MGGGTLYDLGVYCINAARYLFRAEPKEVFGCSVNSVPKKLPDIDESTAAILRFDRERIATFVTSFNAADAGSYEILGTKGHLKVDPAYEYAEGLAYELTIGGKKKKKKKMPRSDQFAPGLLHFSDCILRNREPEPSGLEGLQDVRIVQALYESASSGKPVSIPPYRESRHPSTSQAMRRPPVREPELVNSRQPFEE